MNDVKWDVYAIPAIRILVLGYYIKDCGDLWGSVFKNGVLNKGIKKGLNAFCAF